MTQGPGPGLPMGGHKLHILHNFKELIFKTFTIFTRWSGVCQLRLLKS